MELYISCTSHVSIYLFVCVDVKARALLRSHGTQSQLFQPVSLASTKHIHVHVHGDGDGNSDIDSDAVMP